jgi:hypothetical protein
MPKRLFLKRYDSYDTYDGYFAGFVISWGWFCFCDEIKRALVNADTGCSVWVPTNRQVSRFVSRTTHDNPPFPLCDAAFMALAMTMRKNRYSNPTAFGKVHISLALRRLRTASDFIEFP